MKLKGKPFAPTPAHELGYAPHLSGLMRRIAQLSGAGGCVALVALLLVPFASFGGFFYAGTSPTNVPWAGGIVPYEFHTNLSVAQKQTYLDGLREWELAANVQFVPRSSQAQYVLFKYDPFANLVSGANPQLVEINRLSRSQICHEMGHAFGFTHENIRPDQTEYLTVLTNNIDPPSEIVWFVIDSTGVTNGTYDFESVMHLANNFSSIDPANLYTQLARPAYARFQPRMGNWALSQGDRAALAYLYGPPALPLTNVVTTTADTAPGSLRAALHYAVDHPGTTIRFNLPTDDAGFSNGVFNIHLTGHLPPLVADGTVIDGSTQPGFTDKPLIVVDGSQLLPEAQAGSVSGLLIYAANCAVRSLSFTRFNWNGITMLYPDATNNTIAGCWSGIDFTGTNAAPNDFQGILISDGASRNIIGGTNGASRNVISGNTQYGIWIAGTNTVGNLVQGNYFGTDWSGSLALTNNKSGIITLDGARDTVIGGTDSGARNVLSGNQEYGIFIGGTHTTGTIVQGNYLGTDATGTAAIPNNIGIGVFDGAHDITIGGVNSAARNIVSGNRLTGVWLEGVSNNLVQGNYLGLDAGGTAALPNLNAGMYVLTGARSNSVTGNVMSGNGSEGLRLAGPGVAGNIVQGNACGTGPFGTNPIANGFAGVVLYAGATANTIGGTTPAARNILSGNGTVGLVLANLGTSGNVVQGNYIGTDVNGSNAVANGFAGVYLIDGAQNNTFGGSLPGAANVVSGNGSHGFWVADPATSSNTIQGNFIGTRADGTNALGNTFGHGIILLNGANHNAIGLALDGSGVGNRVAFSGSDGIRLNDPATIGNPMRGNSIFNNGQLGINLVGGAEDSSGVTANDSGDGDSGPNNLQNFPVITNAFSSPTTTTILGQLSGNVSRTFLIDVYRNVGADDSGYGEGQDYVGSTSLTTSAGGNGSFSFTTGGNFAGQIFTATATDLTAGDTSEFGLAVLVTNVPPPPEFMAPWAMTGTGFSARISLNLGQNYRIQATTNLGTNPITWIELTNFSASATNFFFLDRGATNHPLRFYRVVSP